MAPQKAEAIQDLEYAMRTKGGMTPDEETKLRVLAFLPSAGFILGSGFGSYVGWFSLGIGRKWFGLPPMHGLTRFALAAGCAFFTGKLLYHSTFGAGAAVIMDSENERMKTELANIILTKHSEDRYLVGIVKRHYFAEQLFNDQHQDRPLFRWHPRQSYIDGAYLERVKEIEASSSDDQARSISRQTTVNIRSFGDLMEDPLTCVLGSPGGDIESNSASKNTGTVLKRSDLRAHKRSQRQQRRHRRADELAAL